MPCQAAAAAAPVTIDSVTMRATRAPGQRSAPDQSRRQPCSRTTRSPSADAGALDDGQGPANSVGGEHLVRSGDVVKAQPALVRRNAGPPQHVQHPAPGHTGQQPAVQLGGVDALVVDDEKAAAPGLEHRAVGVEQQRVAGGRPGSGLRFGGVQDATIAPFVGGFPGIYRG